MTKPKLPHRFDGVDILRGISILAVILLHISIRMRGAGYPLQSLLPASLFHLFFRNGNNGVTVFFAISGFLITITSVRRFGLLANMQPWRFYRIRLARIAPLLLLVLAVLSLLHLIAAPGFQIQPQRTSLPRALFAALTFHLNWLEGVHGYLPAAWDILWSLSVEEMFYLFFPIACLLVFRMRRGMSAFVVLLLTFVAMGPFARTIWTTNDIWREKSYLGGMDGIALGCLCALVVESARLRSRLTPAAAGLAGVAMMFLIALWPGWPLMKVVGESGLDGTILALGTCLVIGSTVLSGFTGGVISAPIRWLGRHSYEVYLTHEFIVVWGTQLYGSVRKGPLAVWVIAIALSAMLPGALVARWFSEPLNRWLRGAATSQFPAAQSRKSA